MKKNFFKKLSFVMALAMVLSTLAPAASAFAATSPSLKVTTKYLYLNEEGKASEYDFNIKNKVAGSTYAWSSDNEAVATVDEATGLTVAKAVGKAKITVAIKTGKKTSELTATVYVRDNIKTIDVSNAAGATGLKVGDPYDFNRSYVTFNGSDKVTSSISRWSVEGTGATIEATTGKFVATAAGTYKVTVSAFQSKTLYAAGTYTATKTIEVTVAPAIVSTKQVDPDTFKVTFDSDMSKTDLSKTTAIVAQVINGKNVVTGAEKVKDLKLDATGKIATIDLYTAFTADVKYTFTYGTLTDSFTAATRNISDVAGVVFNDFTVDTTAGTSMLGSVDLVNANGVVILYGNSTNVSSYLTFTYGGDLTKGAVSGSTAYMYAVGNTAPVSVAFNNYVYDSVAKKYNAVSYTDSAVATGAKGTAAVTGTMQFEIVTDASAASDSNWDGTTTMAAKDSGYTIHARYYTVNSPYTYQYTDNNSVFTYTSSDTSKLVINGIYAYPVAAGTVTVVVKDSTGTTVLGTFDVTIAAARSVASVTADNYAVVLGNNNSYGETKNVTLTALDNTGAGIDQANSNIWGSFVNAPTGATTPRVTWTEGTAAAGTAGKIYVAVTATGASVGSYQYKLTVQYNGNAWDTKDVVLSITVLDANSASVSTVAYWQVDLGATSVDKKANYGKNVSIAVNGYNSYGVVVDTLATSEYTVVIKDAAGNVEPTYQTSIPVVTTSGAAVVAWDNDSYTVTAYASGASVANRVNGQYIAANSFSVVNTTATGWTLDDSTVAAGSTVFAAVKEAFAYTLNGSALDETQIVKVVYSQSASLSTATSTAPTLAAGNAYISEVVFRVYNSTNTAYIEYSIYPGYSIAVQ